MPDLTKELKVEKLSHESWEAEKQFRLNRVANRRPANNPEKSLFRQMSWCNANTDHLGNILRMVRDLKVTETPDTPEGKFFNAANKDDLIQKIRAAWISNENNTAYLRELSFRISIYLS